MAFAEAPEVERSDPQTERFEMGAHFAGAVGFAQMSAKELAEAKALAAARRAALP